MNKYLQWSPLQTIVMFIESCYFVLYISAAFTLFKIYYGLSTMALLKIVHIFGIYTRNRAIVKWFFWFGVMHHIVSTIVIAFFSFEFMFPDGSFDNKNFERVMIFDSINGFFLGIFLAWNVKGIFELIWQRLFITELDHEFAWPRAANLKPDDILSASL